MINIIAAGNLAIPWWRHQMETFSALLALCAGNSPVTGEFPTQRPVTRSYDAFFDLYLNKRLSKQSWGWWFETPSRPLRRHCNAMNHGLRDPVSSYRRYRNSHYMDKTGVRASYLYNGNPHTRKDALYIETVSSSSDIDLVWHYRTVRVTFMGIEHDENQWSVSAFLCNYGSIILIIYIARIHEDCVPPLKFPLISLWRLVEHASAYLGHTKFI